MIPDFILRYDWADWVAMALLAGVIVAVSFWLDGLQTRGLAKKGEFQWRYLQFGFTFNVLVIVMGLGVGFIDYAASQAAESQVVPPLVVSGVLTTAFICIAFDVFVRKVRFNSVEIQSVWPFYTRAIKWGPGVSGRYHALLQMGSISDLEGGRIWLSEFHQGLSQLSRYGRMRERRYVFDDLLGLHFSATSEGVVEPGANPSQTVVLNTDDVWESEAIPAGKAARLEISSGQADLRCAGHEKSIGPGWAFAVPNPHQAHCAISGSNGEPVVLKLTYV